MVVLKNFVRVAAAAAIGWIAWRGHVAGLLVAPAIVWVWATSKTRIDAFAALFAYYLAAGRGLIVGASVFFAEPSAPPTWWAGLVIWSLPSLLLAAVWAIGWRRQTEGSSQWQLPCRLLMVLAVISVPPLGLFGWANPLTAAGAWFPGFGWIGLFLLLLLCLQLALPSCRRCAHVWTWGLTAVVVIAASANLKVMLQPTLPAASSRWVGVDTELGASDDDKMVPYLRLRALQDLVVEQADAAPAGSVLVLPELVAGDWLKNAHWWDRVDRMLREKHQTVLLGASRPVARGSRQNVNMLVSIGEDAGIEMLDRVPVPISMWKPFSAHGTRAFWWSSGVVNLRSVRVAHLICYEQLLIWPVLASMAHSPQVLVGVANGWWAKDTSIPAIQRAAVLSWGRLFEVPVVYAKNR